MKLRAVGCVVNNSAVVMALMCGIILPKDRTLRKENEAHQKVNKTMTPAAKS